MFKSAIRILTVEPTVKAIIHSTFVAGVLLMLMACGTHSSPSRDRLTWAVSRIVDPLTDEQRCVVARYDQVHLGFINNYSSGFYSRVGALYPVIENHPKHGLLVGASSGGTVRLPVGDVVWRIDKNPHHVLLARDSPLTANTQQFIQGQKMPALNEYHAAALEQALQTTMSALSTSTFATGEQARRILDEMKVGKTLVFRTEASAPNVGLPSANALRIGEFRDGKLAPIPLDDTFIAALDKCGIR